MNIKNNLAETIIFDGQVFQSAAWDRGMGKYSLNFLKAISNAKNSYSNIQILFSKNIKLPQEIKDQIKDISPKAKLIFLDLKVPKVVPNESLQPIKLANHSILQNYIEETFGEKPIDFVILSLFIDQVCSVFPANSNTRKILLFYDLIPLQYSERYSKSWSYPNYLDRFDSLFSADKIFTISQTVADDIIVYTGINPQKIINIDGAPIDRDDIEPKKPSAKLPKKYILMPSGNEIRKNNFRAIEAFEEFRNSTTNKDWQLVLTSYFDEKTKKDLKQLSDNTIFTGNVSEGELRWLYKNSELLLFVSEYEGLGLPLLEALEFDKPVVCSNLKVFNEMTTTAYYYANPYSQTSIAAEIVKAVDRVDFENKKSQYNSILKRYHWDKTAQKALNFLSIPTEEPITVKDKKRLAIFSPSPSGYSAIGKVVLLQHSALSQYFEIDYFVEHARSDNPFKRTSILENIVNVEDARKFNAKQYANYDAVIYHIGNSEYHLETIKNALHLPGYLIFHDTKLKEVFEDELYKYNFIDKTRLAEELNLDKTFKTSKTAYATSLVNSGLGNIVHSEYSAEALRNIAIEDIEIKKFNLPVGTPVFQKKRIDSRFNVGFAGIIHKSKGINIIDNILSMPDSYDIDIYLFGVPMAAPGEIERLESLGNIKIEKAISDFEFENRLSQMDIIVNYRPNYNGETSLTAIEAMRHGVVPIVRRIGWFDELPDECVEKVSKESEIPEAIIKLKNNPEYLSKKKRAAKKYVEDAHSYHRYANELHEFLNKQSPVNNKLNRQISMYLKQGKTKQEILGLFN